MTRRHHRALVLGAGLGLLLALALTASAATGAEGADFLRGYLGFGLAFPAGAVALPVLWLPAGAAVFPLVALPLNGACVAWLAATLLGPADAPAADPVPPSAERGAAADGATIR